MSNHEPEPDRELLEARELTAAEVAAIRESQAEEDTPAADDPDVG